MSDKSRGTSEMPQSETLNYDVTFHATKVFLNDLKIILKDVAYADAQPYFDFLEHYNYTLPIAVLNEYLKQLSNLPYKYVNQLFQIIQNKDLFPKYFEEVTAKPAQGQAKPVTVPVQSSKPNSNE